MFGIRDNKVWKRLLCEPRLILAKTDEICRAAESLDTQMKTITDESSQVSTIKAHEHLSDITKPLRELTQTDIAWVWDHPQQEALEKLKQAAMSTPVL